ncbi:hypothetical protein H257_18158 [Aphanomyces astaci]|uniref:Uncharacterized protein n=1 Tax=Aphanomyces astaci TaxID=112090 RepID=W4FDS3_APHAT|nr:hypothetical protein H257_18158 [Aphanomyces astaci]ETV65034.1 hypothetical protein H257_18158 [Aphanomyces astaci]|eukprot:XP_009845470.1 hypothetical protein H257_18158 [Aphanomyces astaci]
MLLPSEWTPSVTSVPTATSQATMRAFCGGTKRNVTPWMCTSGAVLAATTCCRPFRTSCYVPLRTTCCLRTRCCLRTSRCRLPRTSCCRPLRTSCCLRTTRCCPLRTTRCHPLLTSCYHPLRMLPSRSLGRSVACNNR